MAHSPQAQSRRSRRQRAGVILVMAATALAATSARSAVTGQAVSLTSSNPGGVLRSIGMEQADANNPFFHELGTNGRTCATCHRPAQGWSVTPAELRDRFAHTGGLDPIFRPNDGSNCEGADVSTLQQRRRAFSLLLNKGLIRVGLEIPAGAEFDVLEIDDPYRCGGSLTKPSMYRRPLPSASLKFLSAVMWDGRASRPGRGIRDGLLRQVVDAVTGHAEGAPPASIDVRAIVDFELRLFSAQVVDREAGGLTSGEVRGGPRTLQGQPFCIGINDPLGMLPAMPGACAAASGGLNPLVFTLFRGWSEADSPRRRAIARGEAIFNTRQFVIDDVPGLNGAAEDPVGGPIQNGTCSLCHDTPNAGNHSVPLALNLGVADASRRTPDLPLYTLRRLTTGETVQTTDPGRALVTGRWNDIGKFKGPVLRALAARPPYFHDGSAATLADAIRFYDTRFQIRFTAQEQADLLAFLMAL